MNKFPSHAERPNNPVSAASIVVCCTWAVYLGVVCANEEDTGGLPYLSSRR